MADPLSTIGGTAMRALAPALARAVRGPDTPLDRELAKCVREALEDALEQALPDADDAARAETTSALSRGVIRVGESSAMVLPAVEKSFTRAAAQQWWAESMERALAEVGDLDPEQIELTTLASTFGRSLWNRLRTHAIEPGNPVTNLVLMLALDQLSESDNEPPNSAISNLHAHPRSGVFAGRSRLISDLRVSAPNGLSGAKLAFTGSAGIGKSELASHIAATSARNITWWVNAESMDGVLSGLNELAERLGIRTRDAVGELLIQLSRRDDFMLIFDGAPDESSIAHRVPDCRAGGTVLATSLSTRWGSSFRRIPIPPLDRSASSEILAARVTLSGDEAGQIADALGGVPLALHQAAAFMATSGMAPDAYVETLRTRSLELLTRGSAEGYSRTAAAAYSMSRDRAVRDNSLADVILSVISMCASGPIPPEILSVGTATDALEIADAVSALTDHGLVDANELGVSAHALTRLFVRTEMGESSSRDMALRLLKDLPQIVVSGSSRRYFPSILMPHIESLFTRAEGAAPSRTLWEAAMATTAYLRSWGNGLAAEGYAKRAISDAMRMAGPDDSYVFEANLARLELARAVVAASRLDDALVIFRDVLTRAKAAEDWMLAGAVLNDLSHHLETSGDIAGARLASEEAFAIAKRLPDESTRDEALTAAYANRANLERSLGSPAESVRFLQKALEIAEEMQGKPESIATISGNLGLALLEAGRYGEAEAILRKALSIDERELGGSHPSVARDLNNLGLVLHELGDYEGALEVYRRSLEIDLECYGEKHNSTATAMNNIGRAYGEMERFADAESSFRRALQIHEELGGDRAAVASALTNLGGVLLAPEQFGEAMQCLSRAYKIDCSIFGERHIEVAPDANNIGRLLADRGMLRAALKWLNLSASIAEENVGREHAAYGQPVASRAQVYAQLGRFQEALRDARESTDILTEALGPMHPITKSALERRKALEEL